MSILKKLFSLNEINLGFFKMKYTGKKITW